MALIKQSLPRVFKYGKIKLADPDPGMAPKDVLNFYSGTYPELTNASLEGPKIVDDKAVYEFGKTVGTKG